MQPPEDRAGAGRRESCGLGNGAKLWGGGGAQARPGPEGGLCWGLPGRMVIPWWRGWMGTGSSCAGESRWSRAEERGWGEGSPVVEAAINDGIVHGEAHGQPEERQVDLLDELVAVDVLLEAAQDEVEVVGQPADGKCHHHQHHGLHKLVQERCRSLLSLQAPSPSFPEGKHEAPLMPA